MTISFVVEPMTEKSNFFVLTGGPGAGKTTLLRHLEGLGERVVEESIRAVIQADPEARGGEAMFRRAVELDIANFDRLAAESARVFFDRGLMDCHGADGVAPWPELSEALRIRRYNRTVFVFPPWREIYRTDAQRIQDFAHAERVFEIAKGQLTELGYEPLIVPIGTVEARAAFVLDAARRLAV